MINAYKQGKDLYATIAAGVYHNNYEDNLEHFPDGSFNKDGKKRRSSVKSLLLGIMYGRGVASIAEQTGCSTKEAQEIIDNFYNGFPDVKKWMDETNEFAKKNGYVEDLWGRRRRLPDIQLPKFEVKFKDKNITDTEFNPIIGSLGVVDSGKSTIIKEYLDKAFKCRGRAQIDKLKQEALKDNIDIRDNGGFISQAERQCVNARIQGGAATMSKRAMIKVHNDDLLRQWGFKLMLAVHDELIGECPIENQDKVADRLCELMKSAALPEVTVPFKCDPTIERSWYYEDYSASVIDSYKDKLNEGNTEQQAFKYIEEKYPESTAEQLRLMIS